MKSRAFVFIVLLGIGAVAIGWIYEAQLRDDMEKTELEIPDDIDYFLTGLRYRAMKADGEPDYEFRSRRLEHRRRTDVSHIEQPSLQIFRVGDRWRIDAQRGQFEHGPNRMVLESEVVMHRLGDAPLQLFGERIRFEPDLDRVSSDDRVLLVTDASRIEADAAEFDIGQGIYRLRRARAVYHDADKAG